MLGASHARAAVLHRLGQITATDIVISCNVQHDESKLIPSSVEPEDVGVAVYWRIGAKRYALPCDAYTRVRDNMYTIAQTIERTADVERHGCRVLDRLLAAYEIRQSTWWEVFGLSERATLDELKAAWKLMRFHWHPDRGGSAERFAELKAAFEVGKKERS